MNKQAAHDDRAALKSCESKRRKLATSAVLELKRRETSYEGGHGQDCDDGEGDHKQLSTAAGYVVEYFISISHDTDSAIRTIDPLGV